MGGEKKDVHPRKAGGGLGTKGRQDGVAERNPAPTQHQRKGADKNRQHKATAGEKKLPYNRVRVNWFGNLCAKADVLNIQQHTQTKGTQL